MDKILEEFENKGVRQGPDYYIFHGNEAIAVIERCRELNRKIYGIDVFRTEEGNEIVDYIDYTNIGYRDFDPARYFDEFHIEKDKDVGHWEEAKQFIKDRINSGYYFEVVYEK
jgi:hypothetical protein